MAKGLKRWLIICVVILAVAAYVAFMAQAGKKGAQAGVEVEMSQAKPGNLVTVVSGTGKVDAEDKAIIRAEITGLITKVYVKEGQWVNKGDLLVQFHDRMFITALERARLESQAQEQARNHLENTRKNYIHVKQLFEDGAASREQLEAAALALEQEEKQVAQASKLAELNLSNAQEDLVRTKVRATRSGMILYCPVKEGMTAPQGTELCQIGDLRHLVVELPVDEIDITQIKIGQAATVTQEGLSELKLPGTVIEIAPQAVSVAGENVFPVKIRIDNSKGILRSGMSVDTEIITHDLRNVITVPLLAVLDEEKNGQIEKYLFLVKEGKAVKTKIKAGFSNDSDLEVRSGLASGDIYISGDYETILHLKDKTNVREKKIKPEKNKPHTQ
ncbi:MAG: efflux RND transporter periplasmic adaptor subunit [Firmicutes bacterium]|nr:efflux RND transporter periplasmic adaptor subunit [Bacillota bacterium]